MISSSRSFALEHFISFRDYKYHLSRVSSVRSSLEPRVAIPLKQESIVNINGAI